MYCATRGAYQGAAVIFPNGPGAVTLVPLSVLWYPQPPPNSNAVGAPGYAIFGRPWTKSTRAVFFSSVGFLNFILASLRSE